MKSPPNDETSEKLRLRDLALQLQEVDASLTKQISGIRRQILLLLGDFKPSPRITEFTSPTGKARVLTPKMNKDR